jgi:hypothetical protein
VGERTPPPRARTQASSTGDAPAKWWSGGRWTADEIEPRAANAMRVYDIHLARGMSPEQAAGWAANAEAESHGDHRGRQRGGQGYGLFHWSPDRRSRFQGVFGHPMEQSTVEEQLKFRDFELLGDESNAAKLIARSVTAGDYAAAITHHYERPGARQRDAADRANLAEAIRRRARRRDGSGR